MTLKKLLDEVALNAKDLHPTINDIILEYDNRILPTSDETLDSIRRLVECVKLPDDEYGDLQSTDEDVKTSSITAYIICSVLYKIIGGKPHMLRENYKQLWPLLINLCAPLFKRINPWATQECDEISSVLLAKSLELSDFSDSKSVIDELSVFESAFSRIYPNIQGVAWKKSSLDLYTFIYLITNASGDTLTVFLDKILPITLTILDDVVPRHAKNGMKCIHHILSEMPPAELRFRGRIDVLHDALFKKIYTRDPVIVQSTIPCILRSLQCIETEMMRKRGCHMIKHDECFEAVLSNFHLTSDFRLQKVFAQSLPTLVSRMGIQVIGHMKMILIVFEYGFETGDMSTVKWLSKMITELVNIAWLRMKNHVQKLVKFLVKALYSTANDHWRTTNVPQDEVTSATDAIIEALAHLANIDKRLVSDVQAMMKEEKCLRMSDYEMRLQQTLGS